jgi:hypothetical protein
MEMMIDTLEITKKLHRAGVPAKQADAIAKELYKATEYSLSKVVSKEHLDNRINALDIKIDTKIDTVDAKINSKFDILNAKLNILLLLIPIIVGLIKFL